jgi:hypothetical protein
MQEIHDKYFIHIEPPQWADVITGHLPPLHPVTLQIYLRYDLQRFMH